MLIRVYREADEQDVIALWDEALADGAPHNDPPTAIRRKLAVDGDLLLVAEIDGRVVGTA